MRQQFCVCALLDNAALVQDYDQIGIAYGGEPVGNECRIVLLRGLKNRAWTGILGTWQRVSLLRLYYVPAVRMQVITSSKRVSVTFPFHCSVSRRLVP